jgi:hypothetical protein
MANSEDASGRHDFFAWLIVLSMAIAIEAVTGNALIAVLPIAVHAGWKSFRCGWWLKTVDPVSRRAWACFWFYLATACWKAAACAFVTIVIFGVIENFVGQPVPMDAVIAELQVMLCGVVLSVIVGIAAVVSALRGKVRVWVHPGVREQCHGDFNRLAEIRGPFFGNPRKHPHGFNHAVLIVITSVAFPPLVAGTALIICELAILAFRPGPHVFGIAGLLLMGVGALASIPAYSFLASRIVARTPAECWERGGRFSVADKQQ